MSTLILSYPGAGFAPTPAEAGSVPGSATAYAAMGQWLELADHITRLGGHILILDAFGEAAAGGRQSVYAGRLGAPFLTPGTLNRPMFLRARGESAPGQEDPISRAITKAGLLVQVCSHRFQGQLDVISIDRNRFILTYAEGAESSSKAGIEEVKTLLPLGAQTLEVALTPPYTSGAQGIAYLTSAGGVKVLLVHRGALGSHTPEDLAHFAGNRVEYFVLSPEDAEACATECVLIRGTVILGRGSSTILRGLLARRGFQLIETDVSLLFGAKKGGPRVLVNDLPGLVLSDDAPSYALRREELFERRASYKPV